MHQRALKPAIHDEQLAANVFPADWQNPKPAPNYNLVVLGGGTAGLITAAGAAGLGAKVALVERAHLGGDCLNSGCVPSKSLLRSSRAVAAVREAHQYGVNVPDGTGIDFASVMERMRLLRSRISVNDSAKRYKDELGVDVFLGEGSFIDSQTVQIGTQKLKFRRAVIATGTRPSLPNIPGLEHVHYLTNETIFSLPDLPDRLAIIGAGPAGCELAQAFTLFGSQVTLLESGSTILPKEDKDASGLVDSSLSQDGVTILPGSVITQVEKEGLDTVLKVVNRKDSSFLRVDKVVVAVGRTPNIDGLNLQTVGVNFDHKTGVMVDDRLRTSNRRIFAAGDVCGHDQFTHVADAMARIVIQNALFFGRARASSLTVPKCVYTSPELAQVGITEQDAVAQGIPVCIFLEEMTSVDRAVIDGDTSGFAKILTSGYDDKILGATLVGRHASETISEVTLAINSGVGLRALSKTIHPYPTQAEVIKRLADAYNRTRLTPTVKSLLARWLGWARQRP